MEVIKKVDLLKLFDDFFFITSYEIGLRRVPRNPTDDKSTLC